MRELNRELTRKEESGAVTVEFVAVVLPFFLGLVFLIISMSLMFSFRSGLSQAASEGARAAAVQPLGTSAADRLTAAQTTISTTLMAQAGVTCSSGGDLLRGTTDVGSCTITTVANCQGTASCVRVTLEYAYRDHPVGGAGLTNLIPGFSYVLPATVSYQAEARVS